MVFKQFRFQIVLRVLFLTASIAAFSILIQYTEFVMFTVLLSVLIIYQIISIIRYTETINRDLKYFFDSIQFSDFSLNFKSASLGPSFAGVKDAFNNVIKEFLKVRSEKEERFRYFQTVVEHVATGLISFRPDGEVEFINRAALKLLAVHSVRNLNSMEGANKELAGRLLKLKAGERTLVKIKVDGREAHIAVNTTQFKLGPQLFTLVSLQNIQSDVERERMGRELEIGQEVQNHLLPDKKFKIPNFDLAAFCLPAKEVGGDLYDFIQLTDKKFAVIIGDVSGKGLPAAIYMTLTKGILQAAIDKEKGPAEALKKANFLIYKTIGRNFFISLIMAIIDVETNKIQIARAGHNPVIYLPGNKSNCQLLRPNGIALGLEKGEIFDQEIDEIEMTMGSGDVFLFYTDGISEALNKQREEFGEQRMVNILNSNHKAAAEDIISAIQQDVQKHLGDENRHDDMTMLVLKA